MKNNSLLRTSQANGYDDVGASMSDKKMGTKVRNNSPDDGVHRGRPHDKGFQSFKEEDEKNGKARRVQNRNSPDMDINDPSNSNSSRRAKSLNTGTPNPREKRSTDIHGPNLDDSDFMHVSGDNSKVGGPNVESREFKRPKDNNGHPRPDQKEDFSSTLQSTPITTKKVMVQESKQQQNSTVSQYSKGIQHQAHPLDVAKQSESEEHTRRLLSQNHQQADVVNRNQNPSQNQNANNLNGNRGLNNNNMQPEENYQNHNIPQGSIEVNPFNQYSNDQRYTENQDFRQKTNTGVDPIFQYPAPQSNQHQDSYRNHTRTEVDPFYQYPPSQSIPSDAFNRQKTRTDVDPSYQYLSPHNQGFQSQQRPVSRTEADPFYNYPVANQIAFDDHRQMRTRTEVDPFYNYPVGQSNNPHDTNRFRTRTDADPFYNHPHSQHQNQIDINQPRLRTDADPLYNYAGPYESENTKRSLSPQHRISDQTHRIHSQQTSMNNTDYNNQYLNVDSDNVINRHNTVQYPSSYVHTQVYATNPEHRRTTKKVLTDTTILGDPLKRRSNSPNPNEERRIRTLTDTNPFFEYPADEQRVSDPRMRTRTDGQPFHQYPLADNNVKQYDDRQRTRTDVDPFYDYPRANSNGILKGPFYNQTSEMTSSFNHNKKPNNEEITYKKDFGAHPSQSEHSYYKQSMSNTINVNRVATLTNPAPLDDNRYTNVSPSNNIYNDNHKTIDHYNTYTDLESQNNKRSVMAKQNQYHQSNRDYSKSEPFRREKHLNDTISTKNNQADFEVTRTKFNTTVEQPGHYNYNDTTDEEMFTKKKKVAEDTIYKKNGMIYTPGSTKFRDRTHSSRYYDIVKSDRELEIKKRTEFSDVDASYNRKVVLEPEVIRLINNRGQIMVYKINSNGEAEEAIYQKRISPYGTYMKRIRPQAEMIELEEEVIEEEFFFDKYGNDKDIYELFMKQHGVQANEYVKKLSRAKESVYNNKNRVSDTGEFKKTNTDEDIYRRKVIKEDQEFEKKTDGEFEGFSKKPLNTSNRTIVKSKIEGELNSKRNVLAVNVEEMEKKHDTKNEVIGEKKGFIQDEWRRYREIEEENNKKKIKEKGERIKKKKNNKDEAFSRPTTLTDEEMAKILKNKSDRYVMYPRKDEERFDVIIKNEEKNLKKFSVNREENINKNKRKSADIYKKAEHNFGDSFKKNKPVEETAFAKNKANTHEIFDKNRDGSEERINVKAKNPDLKIKKTQIQTDEEFDRRQERKDDEYKKKNNLRDQSYERKKTNTDMTVNKPVTHTEDVFDKPKKNTVQKTVKPKPVIGEQYDETVQTNPENMGKKIRDNSAEEFKNQNNKNTAENIIDRRYKNVFNEPQSFFRFIDVEDITYKKEKVTLYHETLDLIDEFIYQNNVKPKLENLIIDQEEHEFVLKMLPEDYNTDIFDQTIMNTDETFNIRFKILSLNNMEDYKIQYFVKMSKLKRASRR